jgi:hypothetical protein
MRFEFKRSPLALAAVAALAATAAGTAPGTASAAKTGGTYVAGDFHNHTTCSDGSISMQKLVKKATDKTDTPWGLDWFVQAGHGNSGGTRNCTLAEDDSLSTPAYPAIAGKGPSTTWADSIGAANVKGDGNGPGGASYMWRWQSVQEYQYPLVEYLSAYKNLPLFVGLESIVAGHEHSSMSVITGQIPHQLDWATLPTQPGPMTARYTPLGNANALAQWNYCFDGGDTDKSRGNVTGTSIGNNWECSVPGSANSADPSWDAGAQKLVPASGAGVGVRGHAKTLEGIKWMAKYHPEQSYYVPSHLERPGPFNPDGNNGYNAEHLRDFNNAGPKIAFGFETQPGHGAAADRGEYAVRRNTINGVKVDSVGGTTWGGTGVYGAQIGGMWDALLGEGRNWWFFASSDWHNRGMFGPDDRRSTSDFYPGEYQRTYVMVRHGGDSKLRPQAIVDGLRSGNAFAASGQLIDRLAFVACAVPSLPFGREREHDRDHDRDHDRGRGFEHRAEEMVSELALHAARHDRDVDLPNCATMGEKLVVRPGSDVVVSVVVRDPEGTNYSPYSFDNPSLLQVGVHQPLNKPVLDHVDVIRGLVTGYKKPGAPDYSGQWPNTWIANPDLNTVPAGAKNTTAALFKTFNKHTWDVVRHEPEFKQMTFRLQGVKASQYLRLRGSNLPPSVPFETDANGNPLPDLYTNASDPTQLKIPCTAVGSNVPANGATFAQGSGTIDGCPAHLATVNGQKYVSYDVAAWSDLWFYSNPVFIEVAGSTVVAGVK